MKRFAVQTLCYNNSILQPLVEVYRSAVAFVSKIRWFTSMEAWILYVGGLFHDLGRSRGEGPTIWKVKVYKATVAFVSTVRRFYNVEAHNFEDPYDSMDQQCKDSLAWRNLK